MSNAPGSERLLRSSSLPGLIAETLENGGAARRLEAALASLPGRVLYRDGLILVIDKPAGIPVHAGPGGGANLEHWFPLLRFGLPRPPALAHRLDRDTSGVRVLGAADGRAWLELRPRTGRTHQIRVHCAALGCPVVGDTAYGGPDEAPLQ